jgi:histidinol-phosphate phosphatase family protein
MTPHHGPKLVILGRDGILNVFRDDHVKAPHEWVPIEGALEAVARLNQAGWHAVIATNQSGIGRGLVDMTSLNAIHQHMQQLLLSKGGRIDAVKSPSVMASIPWRGCRWSATRCAIWRPHRPPVASRMWCARAALRRSAMKKSPR